MIRTNEKIIKRIGLEEYLARRDILEQIEAERELMNKEMMRQGRGRYD